MAMRTCAVRRLNIANPQLDADDPQGFRSSCPSDCEYGEEECLSVSHYDGEV